MVHLSSRIMVLMAVAASLLAGGPTLADLTVNQRMRDPFNEGLRHFKASGHADQIIADAVAGKYAKPK